ncbi:hypothetical protein DPMN_036567 [Dreissena polymorpha]|uniref:Uncharacterized protein n=1 Tax=Dreissena polymorpha TaxID=45954 RepID=A0A9D4MBR9_DREPO|nr:hypothetical protein DPMN_036567 [Dreissena polymorpha]
MMVPVPLISEYELPLRRYMRTQNAGYVHLKTNMSDNCSASPTRRKRPTSTSGTLRKHLFAHHSPSSDRQTTTTILAWTRQQARLSVQDCSPGRASGRSPSRPSEEKLDGQYEMVGISSHA